MPFKSKSQVRVCYNSPKKGWDCDKWLKETDSICDLPYKSNSAKPQQKQRSQRKDEIRKGPIKTGKRGGRYFELIEKAPGTNKIVCVTKVYLRR